MKIGRRSFTAQKHDSFSAGKTNSIRKRFSLLVTKGYSANVDGLKDKLENIRRKSLNADASWHRLFSQSTASLGSTIRKQNEYDPLRWLKLRSHHGIFVDKVKKYVVENQATTDRLRTDRPVISKDKCIKRMAKSVFCVRTNFDSKTLSTSHL